MMTKVTRFFLIKNIFYCNFFFSYLYASHTFISGWVFGQEGFIFLADGRLVATYSKEGETILVVASVDNKDGSLLTDVKEYSNSKQENDILPMSFGGIVCSDSNELFFLGGSASTPTSIYKWNLDSPTEPALQLICSSSSKFSSDYISTPKQIEFETTGGKTAFGYYYPPLNKDYTCAKGEEVPPLLVKAHGTCVVLVQFH